ncbi:biotin--[acetyl-CoA-carboxylase] ligase [Carnobacterium jeotgali]|uniref:biotin--[acetyl-CoA-carboxylase] ligase n=1 Tax=Carnobacterium jeotgali TaxID=545534 RepID=UPI00049344CC|nr:biotin--[acetyl-CoA-carboxylase] ligase [Carnobacterium jeotgali]
MSTKLRILALLEQQNGKSISGQTLADALSLSRTSVWKGIKALQEEGYIIEAVTNKGYRLSSKSDILSIETIRLYLQPTLQSFPIYAFKTIDSTNNEARKIAIKDSINQGLVLSEEQTKGRGRMGKTFYSPNQTGVYMSFFLKPNLDMADAPLVTTATAVAVCLAIEKLTAKKPQIKWVNDIYLDGTKICGILTEAVSDFESGKIETLIVGIGLNVKEPLTGFPAELDTIAGSLISSKETENINRNRLIAEIANQFDGLYQTIEERSFLEDYKKRCFVIGKKITFKERKQEFEAIPIDIDPQGGLVVQMADGQKRILSYGEISIKKPF